MTIGKIREIAELIGALDALREKRYNEPEIKDVTKGVLGTLADNLLEAKYASEPIEGILKEAKDTLVKYTAEPEKARETGEEKGKGEKNRNDEAEKNGIKDPRVPQNPQAPQASQNPQNPQNPQIQQNSLDVLTQVTKNISEITGEKTADNNLNL
ncbi:MAG: hypothetical protein LBU15_01570 [Rickettsiales bacterium]|nr:hypothetical protein [Rickettsiales bacterium]